MKQIIECILNVIFPRRCAVCDRIVKGEDYICRECLGKVRVIQGAACRKCGKQVNDNEILCYDCRRRNHIFDRGVALFEYPDIKESLYRFKYSGRAEYARFYAALTIQQHASLIKSFHAEALIPVPLHPKRMMKRGYNQAEEYAKELSILTDIPIRTDLVKRIKNTKAQKNLKALERQNNLKKAFLFRRNDVKLKTIIIIDDIYTTGSTIDAVSAVCRDAGIEKIYFLCIAVGNG